MAGPKAQRLFRMARNLFASVIGSELGEEGHGHAMEAQ